MNASLSHESLESPLFTAIGMFLIMFGAGWVYINRECRLVSYKVSQWRSTSPVIDWFKSLREKQHRTFMVFDIVDFYPSVSATVNRSAVMDQITHTLISELDLPVIM